jgi:hypothetical protein
LRVYYYSINQSIDRSRPDNKKRKVHVYAC